MAVRTMKICELEIASRILRQSRVQTPEFIGNASMLVNLNSADRPRLALQLRDRGDIYQPYRVMQTDHNYSSTAIYRLTHMEPQPDFDW